MSRIQLRAMDNPTSRLLEVSLLSRRQFVIEDDNIASVACTAPGSLPPCPTMNVQHQELPALHDFLDDFGAGAFSKRHQFRNDSSDGRFGGISRTMRTWSGDVMFQSYKNGTLPRILSANGACYSDGSVIGRAGHGMRAPTGSHAHAVCARRRRNGLETTTVECVVLKISGSCCWFRV